MAVKFKIMQMASPAVYAFYLYDEIKEDGYDWWTDETIKSETSANFFRDELCKIPPDAEIALYINSLGGDVKEGLAICNILKRHRGLKTAYIDGFACSMASVVAVSCDKVVMPRNTLMMIHNAWVYACGNSSELRKAAEDLDKINEAATQNYLLHAGEKLTPDTLKKLMDAETWLSADECIKYGLADEFAQQDADIIVAREMLDVAKAAAAQRSGENVVAARAEKIAAAALATIPVPDTSVQGTPKEENHAIEAFAHLLHAFTNH